MSSVVVNANAAIDMGRLPYEIPPTKPENFQFAHIDVETFTIPAHLGEINYSFKGESDRVVVHLQDAHCNSFAQYKISGIIDYMNNEYGINVINLEGGVGDYDLSVFTSISDGAIREEVADHFVKNGEINGAEFYAINNPDRVQLWGVEDRELYLKNLKIYRDSLKYKQDVDRYLKELSHILNNLKRHIYSQELLKMDMAYVAYKTDNKGFKEYLQFLLNKAKYNGVEVRKLSNLFLLSQAMEQEKVIDFRKASIERNVLVDELKKNLSKNELRQLLSQTVNFKIKKLSRKAFYNFLLKKAKDVDINIERFPALSNYIVYIALYEAVDRYKVMDEVYDLETKIKELLYSNDEQRLLNTLSRNLALTKNIFDILLIKPDYEYYLKNENLFAIHNYLAFIEKESPKYKIEARPDPDITVLDEYREEVVKFFEYSFKRDEAFLKNMKFGIQGEEVLAYESLITGRGKNVALIMTGGFHTENLCRILEEKDISYVSIMPKFTTEEDHVNPYFGLLAGQTTDVQRMLGSVLAKAMMMQVASKFTSLGRDVWGEEGISGFKVLVKLMELGVVKIEDIDTSKEFELKETGIGIDGRVVVITKNDQSTIEVPVHELRTELSERTVSEYRISSPESRAVIAGVKGSKEKGSTKNYWMDLMNEAFTQVTSNRDVDLAALEKFAIYSAVEAKEQGNEIVVVTAEPSAFSVLNNAWEHTPVDGIRDEFGKVSERFLNNDDCIKELDSIGVTGFTTYYSPYGGQWQYVFAVNEKYDKEAFKVVLAEMLEESTEGAREKARTFTTDADVFNVIMSVSEPVNVAMEINDFYQTRKTKLLDEMYEIKRQVSGEIEKADAGIRAWINNSGQSDVEEEIQRWISLIEAGPPREAVNSAVANLSDVSELQDYFYTRLSIYPKTQDFAHDFEKAIDFKASKEYHKEKIVEAINETYALIAYAENSFYSKAHPPWAARWIREKEGSTDMFAYVRDKGVPARDIQRIFFLDGESREWIEAAKTYEVQRVEQDEVDQAVLDKFGIKDTSISLIKVARLPQHIPNFYKIREEMRLLMEEIDNSDTVSEELENKINKFVSNLMFLSLESEFGTLQGTSVINTLMQWVLDMASNNEVGMVFRLNIDIDHLSSASKEMGDYIKSESLKITKEVFDNVFAQYGDTGSLAAMAQKGAGDESVVLGYFNGEQNDLEDILRTAVTEINRRLSLLEFAEGGEVKPLRYAVSGNDNWAASISAGAAFLHVGNVGRDPGRINGEASFLDSKAEIANNYVKKNGRADIAFYSEDVRVLVDKDKKVESYPFDNGIPEILLPYAMEQPLLASYLKEVNLMKAQVSGQEGVMAPDVIPDFVALEKEFEITAAEGILASVKYGIQYAVIIPITEDQELFDRSHIQNVGNATKRLLRRKIGANITVLYYQKDDMDALFEAYQKITNDNIFMEDKHSSILAYAYSGILEENRENIESFKKLEKVKGVVVEIMEEDQRMDEVM
ncbi:MAG: hypothetical protein KAI70_06440, partial [Candidatus Omnitrophica bacterium]|nr:hypothetical protein [Candidatus Omnitrophota bacterium]